MTQWWEIDSPELPGTVPKFRAVAYYRHSAQDRQENRSRFNGTRSANGPTRMVLKSSGCRGPDGFAPRGSGPGICLPRFAGLIR